MRAILVALISGAAVLSAACGFFGDEVEFTFDNRTDSAICYYPSDPDALAATCLQEAKPQSTTVWIPGCGDGPGAVGNSITVVLTVKEGARQIYTRTEECGTWNDTDRTFVIEKRGDDFLVIDPFVDATPSH